MLRPRLGLVLLTVVLVAAVATPLAWSRLDATDTVTMKEFKFTLATKTVKKGSVTFRLKNVGKVAHDFKIAGKKSKLISAGKSGSLTVTFTRAGRFPYVCTVPGHAAAGMKGTLTVK